MQKKSIDTELKHITSGDKTTMQASLKWLNIPYAVEHYSGTQVNVSIQRGVRAVLKKHNLHCFQAEIIDLKNDCR